MTAEARDLADQLTHELTDPATAKLDPSAAPHSLASGAAGIALLHIERAHTEPDKQPTAHRWLTLATSADLHADHTASLFHDVPALAFVLHTAAHDSTDYPTARYTLDTATVTLTQTRLQAAHARIDRGECPRFAEYDLIQGLTGLGTYHLTRHPHAPITADVLTYLVRLTEPLPDGQPGWWTNHGPFNQPPHEYPGGHANLGLAHGIAGPLALLALALRQGVVVDQHADAITRICTWLAKWQQHRADSSWWPQWITLGEAQADASHWPHPPRASWCYGTPGIARAHQLAALATNNVSLQHDAEHALLTCLRDHAQTDQITEIGLCHGAAGLLHTAHRMAHDDRTGSIADHLPRLTALLAQRIRDTHVKIELLDGTAGAALALHAASVEQRPLSHWDRCLLLS
jgi:hypothetical protein